MEYNENLNFNSYDLA